MSTRWIAATILALLSANTWCDDSDQATFFDTVAVSREQPSSIGVPLQGGAEYLIAVQQHHLDVSLSILTSKQQELGTFNWPLTGDGVDYVWFRPRDSATYTVRVQVADRSVQGGFFSLSIARVVLTDQERAVFAALNSAAQIDETNADQRSIAMATYQRTTDALSDQYAAINAAIVHAKGRLEELNERPSAAIDHYEIAAQRYSEIGEDELAGWVQYRQASMETYRDRYERSRQLLRQILDASNTLDIQLVAAAQNYIGVNFFYEGDFDAAETWVRRSLTSLEKASRQHDLATTYYNLGWIRLQAGDATGSQRYFQRALDIEIELEDVVEQIDTHVSLAGVYMNTGDCGGAISELGHAYRKTKAQGNNRQMTRIMNRAAHCYSMLGDYRAAEALYSRAIEIAESTEDGREQADARASLGDVYFLTGRYQSARDAHARAALAQEDMSDILGVVRTRTRLGRDYIALREFGLADEQLMLASAALNQTYSLSDSAEIALAKGILYRHQQRDKQSISALRQAQSLFSALSDPVGEFQSLLEQGRTLRTSDLRQSMVYFDRAIALLETPRSRVARPELRARFLASTADVFLEQATATLDTLSDQNTDTVAKTSFLAINRGRARTLFDSRRLGEDARVEDVNDAALSRVERQLRAKLVALREALDNQGTPEGVVTTLRADIELLQLQIDAAIQDESANENLTAPVFDATDISLLQSTLGEQAALMQFAFIGDEVIVWLVTNSSIEVQRIPNAMDIVVDARSLHTNIKRRGRVRDIGLRLSEELLGLLNLAGDIDHLMIVPDGPLHFVPFATLTHPSTGDMLVDAFEISVVPSPFILEKLNTVVSEGDILVLADAVFSPDDPRWHASNDAAESIASLEAIASAGTRSNTLSRLPFSAEEAQFIVEEAASVEVDALLGLEANQQALAAMLEHQPAVLHLATHGIADMAYPEAAGLVLSPTDKNIKPPLLTPSDVDQLPFVPPLVVLSACDTAVGENLISEGPLSIARAFLLNGADHVVASIWQVSDRSTSGLMRAFYAHHLAEQGRPAAALRTAQQQIRANPRYRHPYYWAGFSVTTTVID